MINQELHTYIQQQLAAGMSREQIVSKLVETGWQQVQVEAEFNAMPPISEFKNVVSPSVSNMQVASTTISNPDLITEKEYPITILWVFKWPIVIIVVSVIAFFALGIWFPYLVILFPYILIANPLKRSNFHYCLDSQYLTVKEGVISKKERHLPYAVIQNVFVKQDIFDRLFGLAAIQVENAVQGGEKKGLFGLRMNQSYKTSGTMDEGVGSQGNRVSIPGMRKKDAEGLKNAILQKMKENPLRDTRAGL